MGLAEYDEAVERYQRPDRIRVLEAAVRRLTARVDELENVVLLLCEQDGDVQFTPGREQT